MDKYHCQSLAGFQQKEQDTERSEVWDEGTEGDACYHHLQSEQRPWPGPCQRCWHCYHSAAFGLLREVQGLLVPDTCNTGR